MRSVLDGDYDVVAAIVTYNEPTELLSKYAPYRLWIAADAVQQPGGAAANPAERRVERAAGPGGRGMPRPPACEPQVGMPPRPP